MQTGRHRRENRVLLIQEEVGKIQALKSITPILKDYKQRLSFTNNNHWKNKTRSVLYQQNHKAICIKVFSLLQVALVLLFKIRESIREDSFYVVSFLLFLLIYLREPCTTKCISAQTHTTKRMSTIQRHISKHLPQPVLRDIIIKE